MDELFLPIVGRKVAPPAQEDVDAARKVWESFDVKTEEEIALSADLRSCRKDPERAAELKAQRAALEAERKAKKDAAKVIHKGLESRLTKKAPGSPSSKQVRLRQPALLYGTHSIPKAPPITIP